MGEENNEWKVQFINLPCDEQLHFVQKIALDEHLRKQFNNWLLSKDKPNK